MQSEQEDSSDDSDIETVFETQSLRQEDVPELLPQDHLMTATNYTPQADSDAK